MPPSLLPAALGDLHAALVPGDPVELHLPAGDGAGDPAPLPLVVEGAGFDVHRVEGGARTVVVVATRARTLADTVGPGMRLLVCGLNPSLVSADVGTGFARPSNRFWPAALAAGIASRPRDPCHALRHHGTGMTDLVKRATARADELDASEYRHGLARVEHLCRWLRPAAVCFVGLAGWRAAVDRRATAGEQPERLGGVPAYLMPSTSGLNAHSRPADLADHLRAARAVAERRSTRAPRPLPEGPPRGEVPAHPTE